MPDDRCRITVIGDRHQVDVAVPAWAPVGEYAPALARLCGQSAHDALPPAWSLARASAAPVPLAHSLAQAGILDGQRLYLRDIATGEADEPVVADIAEVVYDTSQRRGRLGHAARIATVTLLGLAWLATAAIYLLFGRPEAAGGTAALVIVALLLPTAVWIMKRRQAVVPDALCAAIALGAVPCLAGAGALVAPELGAGSGVAFVAACGAGLGALTALAAIPGELTLAVQLLATVTAAAAGILTALHGGPVRGAAAVAVIAIVIASVAPRAAAVLAGISFSASPPPAWNPQVVQDTFGRTLRLLPVLTIVPAAALVVSLVVLARSPGVFGPSLAAVIAAGLLARAAGAALTAQAVPLAVAGLTGLFAVLAAGGGRTPAAAWAAPGLVAVGAVIVAVATAVMITTGVGPDPLSPGTVAVADRHSWPEVIGLLCNLATLPLALGVFGVLHQVMTLGRHL